MVGRRRPLILSYPAGTIEHMFDPLLLEPAELSAVDDGALIDAVAGYARASAVCDARRLAAVAELVRRRCSDEQERAGWVCDTWDSAAAEVAAAMNIGHGRALGQLYLAEALDVRLPRINALFLAGSISLRLVVALKFRTALVNDDVIAAVDAALAADAVSWGPLSDEKLEKKIDVLIECHDPNAVHRLREAARRRTVGVGKPDDTTGTASIWGLLLATDAEVLDKRLDAMARSVCNDDPRTRGQRRADALGALAAGTDHLACLCGGAECPAASVEGRASNVVIHIVGDPSALTAVSDPGLHGEGFTPSTPAPEPTPTAAAAAAKPVLRRAESGGDPGRGDRACATVGGADRQRRHHPVRHHTRPGPRSGVRPIGETGRVCPDAGYDLPRPGL